MKKLLGKIFLLTVLVFITYLFILALPMKPYFIYSALLDKHQRLESLSGKGRKMVFIGGSSLALGLDSAQVEKETGIPVVNMGVNGGFGLRYMLDEVRDSLKEGDVVVLAPEYDHWYGSLLDGELNMLWAIRVHPASFKQLSSPKQYWIVAKNTPEFMQNKLMEFLSRKHDPVYNRAAFNPYGDFTKHLDQPPVRPLAGITKIDEQPFNADTVEVLRAFGEFARSRKATVLYVPPPLVQTQYDFANNREAIQKIEEQVRGISSLKVIGKAQEYVFPETLFFDTVYHLNREGRQLRTKKTILQIERALSEPSQSRKSDTILD